MDNWRGWKYWRTSSTPYFFPYIKFILFYIIPTCPTMHSTPRKVIHFMFRCTTRAKDTFTICTCTSRSINIYKLHLSADAGGKKFSRSILCGLCTCQILHVRISGTYGFLQRLTILLSALVLEHIIVICSFSFLL